MDRKYYQVYYKFHEYSADMGKPEIGVNAIIKTNYGVWFNILDE